MEGFSKAGEKNIKKNTNGLVAEVESLLGRTLNSQEIARLQAPILDAYEHGFEEGKAIKHP